MERAGSGTPGRNEAIGGVNYKQGNSRSWDRHITSCREDDSGALLFSAGSESVLKISSSGGNPYAVVFGPDRAVRFDKSQCDVFRVKLATTREAGSEDLICSQDGATLNSAIRFGRCTR